MHHLLKHINQDITRRKSKDKDSAVNKTEYPSKEIQYVNPGGHDKPHFEYCCVIWGNSFNSDVHRIEKFHTVN